MFIDTRLKKRSSKPVYGRQNISLLRSCVLFPERFYKHSAATRLNNCPSTTQFRFAFGLAFGVALGLPDVGGGFSVAVSGLAVDKDFMYATTCNSCSSLI
jgi:hypothetical protein